MSRRTTIHGTRAQIILYTLYTIYTCLLKFSLKWDVRILKILTLPPFLNLQPEGQFWIVCFLEYNMIVMLHQFYTHIFDCLTMWHVKYLGSL